MISIKKIGAFLSTLSVLFILLHSIILHNHNEEAPSPNHYEEIVSQSNVENSNIVDFIDNILGKIAKTYIGLNHLENFKNTLSFQIFSIQLYFVFKYFKVEKKTIYQNYYSFSYISIRLFSLKLLRAPPIS